MSLAAAAMLPSFVSAGGPAESRKADDAERGARLLNSLKARSASQRWDDLSQEDALRPLFPGDRKPSVDLRESRGGSPAKLPAAVLGDPVAPFPGRKSSTGQAATEAPSARFAKPIAAAPDRFNVWSGIARLKHAAGQKDVAAPPARQPSSPLRNLSDISPFPDYQPPDYQPGKQPNTEPEKFWKEAPYQPRQFGGVVFNWEASNLAYNPLYFEDGPLERYGHTYPECVQPFHSVGLFSAQFLALPYQMTIDPVCKCIYPLGWYRPGEVCVPELCYVPPWNTKAAAVEAGVVTGLFFLIP